tara:strand:- start:1 stop:246 length:246 start_codon:yes stop_codon:yes gene_type:complete
MSFTVATPIIASTASEINGQISTYNANINVCIFFPIAWLMRDGAPANVLLQLVIQGLGLSSRLGRIVVNDFLIDLCKVELA